MDRRCLIFTTYVCVFVLFVSLFVGSVFAEEPKKGEDIVKRWWKETRKHVEQVIVEQDREVMELESPKWFECGYSTLGRMPLIDTCLREPLNMAEVAIHFDDLCQKNCFRNITRGSIPINFHSITGLNFMYPFDDGQTCVLDRFHHFRKSQRA